MSFTALLFTLKTKSKTLTWANILLVSCPFLDLFYSSISLSHKTLSHLSSCCPQNIKCVPTSEPPCVLFLQGTSSLYIYVVPYLTLFLSLPKSTYSEKPSVTIICHCHHNTSYQTLRYHHISLTRSYYYSLLTSGDICIRSFPLECELHEDRGFVLFSSSSVAHNRCPTDIWQMTEWVVEGKNKVADTLDISTQSQTSE